MYATTGDCARSIHLDRCRPLEQMRFEGHTSAGWPGAMTGTGMKPPDEFRTILRQQAVQARRAMVKSGELLTDTIFRERLGVDSRRLGHLVRRGSVFSIEVDGEPFFPALLADTSIDQKRLHSVCRILVPAPPAARLDYLTSTHGNLGGLTPLQTLANMKSYRHMKSMAHAYAASWSRTTVTIYRGVQQTLPKKEEPVITVVEEADPRINVWVRAASALKKSGYIHPDAPFPFVESATVFIARSGGGKPVSIEARVEVYIGSATVSARFFPGGEFRFEVTTIADASTSITDIISRLIIERRASRR
ncbi:hypothetical protein P3T18_003122 [Paraburkholderia sp. GAS199]